MDDPNEKVQVKINETITDTVSITEMRQFCMNYNIYHITLTDEKWIDDYISYRRISIYASEIKNDIETLFIRDIDSDEHKINMYFNSQDRKLYRGNIYFAIYSLIGSTLDYKIFQAISRLIEFQHCEIELISHLQIYEEIVRHCKNYFEKADEYIEYKPKGQMTKSACKSKQ